MKFEIVIFSLLTACVYCNHILSKSVHISTKTRPLHQPIATVPSKDISSPCFAGFQCMHGKCRKVGEFLISDCICEPGWTGLLCDQRMVPWKSRDPTESNVHVNSIKTTTNSFSSFQKIRNGEIKTDTFSKVDQEHKTIGRAIDKQRRPDDASHVCGNNYRDRSFEERTCTPGLLCRFGTCSIDHQGTYIAYSCRCDKGATGIFCEHKCCLDCGEHGICELFNNGTQFCNCKLGYTGGHCQFAQTAEGTFETDPVFLHHKWAVFIGLFVLASFILLAILVGCVIWRRSLRGKGQGHLACQDNADAHDHQYDVFLWYDNNEADDTLVRQVLSPVIEQSGLTTVKFTLTGSTNQVESQTVGTRENCINDAVLTIAHSLCLRKGREERIKSLIEQSRRCIIIFTPNFVQNCSNEDISLLKKYSLTSKHKLVYLCTKKTLQSFHVIKIRLAGFIHRHLEHVYMKCPCLDNEQEVKVFQEHFSACLPPKISQNRRTSISSIQFV